ncbi:unnamed protein product, partial [Prorocentrum cordatum]
EEEEEEAAEEKQEEEEWKREGPRGRLAKTRPPWPWLPLLVADGCSFWSHVGSMQLGVDLLAGGRDVSGNLGVVLMAGQFQGGIPRAGTAGEPRAHGFGWPKRGSSSEWQRQVRGPRTPRAGSLAPATA